MRNKNRTLHLMGTVIQISVSHEEADTLLDEAEKKLIDYERRFSANDKNSDLMQINLSAGIRPTKVKTDLFELIKIGKEQSLLSDSFLNIAIGPLVQEWRIGFKEAHYPSELTIKKLLTLIDPNKIQLDSTTETVYLEEKGMSLDLGALAKGYFADKIVAFFKKEGAKSGFIDLGGNVLTFGDAPNHEDGLWRIGIQNPFLPRGNFATIIKVKNQSVVTSGIYERTFEFNGKTYHHIFDSKTGYPIRSELASITVISKESLMGEILTTRFFGENPQIIIKEINRLKEVEGLVITTSEQIAYSKQINLAN